MVLGGDVAVHVDLRGVARSQVLSRVRERAVPGGVFLATVGHASLTRTGDFYGAPMYWSHACAETYCAWLSDVGIDAVGCEFIPEDPRGGHELLVGVRRSAIEPRHDTQALVDHPADAEPRPRTHSWQHRPMACRLILLCGLPGAGKSTIARRLAVERRAVRLPPDEWLAGLLIDFHDEAMRDRLEVLFWRLAQDLLHLGQNVILESGFWIRADRDEKRSRAQELGALAELHYLNVPFNERLQRIEQRNSEARWGTVPVTREQLATWEQLFEPPDAEEMSLFDVVTVERGGRNASR